MSTFAFSGGFGPTTGYGQFTRVTFDGTWEAGDQWTLLLAAGDDEYTFGFGDVTGLVPTFARTLKNKLNFVVGSRWAFSASAVPTQFEQQNTGAGYVISTNQVAATENLVAVAPYQGRLALIARNTTQIWTIAAAPSSYVQDQILNGIGTYAPLSVQQIGDLDIFMLHDSGVRSVRVRDSSNNAYVVDIGSAVDGLVTAKATGSNPVLKENACAAFVPNKSQYLLFLKDTIYVLSYFPQAKVVAWSTFLPSTVDGSVTFEKFVVLDGAVYVRATNNKIYKINGYDAAQVTMTLPWMDAGKPGTGKQYFSLDVVIQGTWTVYFSVDFEGDVYTEVGTVTSSTLARRRLMVNGVGTHFSVKLVSTSALAAKVASVIVYYNEVER